MATNEKSSAVLTDAEIKKALECCIWNDGCEQCPISEKCFFFYNKPYAETPEILRLSLDLINRLEADKEALIAGQETLQKALAKKNAEIEELTGNLKFVRGTVERQKVDNERLKNLLAEEEVKYSECAKRFYKLAIKEFTEIIESNDYTGGGVHLEVSRSFWDKTKKEMAGE